MLVHRFRNNYTIHLSVNPIDIVIYETMYQWIIQIYVLTM